MSNSYRYSFDCVRLHTMRNGSEKSTFMLRASRSRVAIALCIPACIAFFMSLLLLVANAVQAEPLIVTEGVEIPEVHCSFATSFRVKDLEKMIGRPYKVFNDDTAGPCLTIDAKLEKKPSKPDEPSPPPPPPHQPWAPWCYCRDTVANSIRSGIESFNPSLSRQIVIAEHNALVDAMLCSENLPNGVTQEQARMRYKDLGLFRVDPHNVNDQVFGQINRTMKQYYKEGLSLLK